MRKDAKNTQIKAEAMAWFAFTTTKFCAKEKHYAAQARKKEKPKMGNKDAIRGYTLDQLCNQFLVLHVFQVKSALGAYKQVAIIEEWDDDYFAVFELCPEMSRPLWFYSEGIEKTDHLDKALFERAYTSLYPLEHVVR